MDPLPPLAARAAPISASRIARRALAAVLATSLLGGCAAVSPRPIPTTLPVRSSTSLSTQPPTKSASVSPRPTSASRAKAGVNGKIVFYRTDDARSTNTPFMIDADGSHEAALHDGGLLPGYWSPDGRQLLVAHLVTDPSPAPGAETAWIRPATVNADGSGFTVLDASPGRKMQLAPVGWSPDGSRVLVASGGEDIDQADMGLYSLRASNGTDLTRITVTPAGHNDIVLVSPDRSKILINRSTNDNDRALFIINVDGTGRVDITDPGQIAGDLEFYDGISADWSPDGSRIVFCAQTDPSQPPSLWVAGNVWRRTADGGSDPFGSYELGLGCVSAQWAPPGEGSDPRVIAFTSPLRDNAQVWVSGIHAMGLTKLTSGADGSSSVAPVWSPDGTKLLFQRRHDNVVTLWTMNADGTGQKQLSATPLAADYVGGYAWWPAIGN
jgi:Tol biopolymer transport system component